MKRNGEFGIGNSEWNAIPNSAFRIPNLLAIGVFVSLFAFPAAVRACPGCKEALIEPAQALQKQSTARGYNLSIALMLAVPATLIGATSALVVRSGRRNRRLR